MSGVRDIHLPAILTGISFGIDDISQIFLFFTVPVWIVCALLAASSLRGEPGARRFFLSFAAACAGSIGLILSQDMVSFYVCFALMTFAAYPLVTHDGTRSADYAGKVYITMAVIGEVMLVSAMMMIAAETGSFRFRDAAAAIPLLESGDLIIALILGGFGIKVGALSLHMWMPLAYAAAPTAASAALSGGVVKAGILGWLRFLPLGEAALPGWGGMMIAAGLAAALYGVAVGLAQNDPKTVLAYSSISQMGIMTAGLGIGLSSPDLAPAGVQAVLFYSIHHALNKAALFGGVGVADVSGPHRRASLICLLLPSLGLAGAPFTSGAAAKAGVKGLAVMYQGQFHLLLEWLLPLTSVATTILMGRFLWVVSRKQRSVGSTKIPFGLWVPWSVLLVLAAVTGWFVPFDELSTLLRKTRSVEVILSSLWPVIAGALILVAAWQVSGQVDIKFRLTIPPGDVLVAVVGALLLLKSLWSASSAAAVRKWGTAVAYVAPVMRKTESVAKAFAQGEQVLSLWQTAGVAIFLVIAVLFGVMILKG